MIPINNIISDRRQRLCSQVYELNCDIIKYRHHPLFNLNDYNALFSSWFQALSYMKSNILKQKSLSPKYMAVIQTSEYSYMSILKSMIRENEFDIARQIICSKIFPQTFSSICKMYTKNLDDFILFVCKKNFSTRNIDGGLFCLLERNASISLIKKCFAHRDSLSPKEYTNFFPYAFRGSDTETIHFLRDRYGYLLCYQDNDAYITSLCSSDVCKTTDIFIRFKTSFLLRPTQYDYTFLFKTCKYHIMKYLLLTDADKIIPNVEEYFTCLSYDVVHALYEYGYDFSTIILKQSYAGIKFLHIFFRSPGSIFISSDALFHLAQYNADVFSYLFYEGFDIPIKNVKFVVSDAKIMKYLYSHSIQFLSFTVNELTKYYLHEIKKYSDSDTKLFFALKTRVKKMFFE